MASLLKSVANFNSCKLTAGIGRATVKALAKCGAQVLALSRTQADLEALEKEVYKSHD